MKAEYICADQPVTLIFRLRQSGGPYIPVCTSSAQNRRQAPRLPRVGLRPAPSSRCLSHLPRAVVEHKGTRDAVALRSSSGG